MSEIEAILNERGSRYGDFGTQAKAAQAIRDAFKNTPNWSLLPPYMREGLDLVATKISRMLCGDLLYLDNVVDIIGYMTLVKEEMEKEHARIEEFAKRAGAKKAPSLDYERAGRVESTYKPDDGPFASPLNWTGSHRNP